MRKVRSNHNNLLNYFVHDKRDLSPAYVKHCEKFLKEISDKLQATSTKQQAASNKLDRAWAMGYTGIMSSRTLKPIFQRGGARRQEILDQAVKMLASRSGPTQGDKMHFCMTNLGMDDTEYLECLNKASNGGVVKAALWN